MIKKYIVRNMQGVSTTVLLPDTVAYDGATLVPVDIGTQKIFTMRNPQTISVVELGKKLLIAARNGDTEEVRELMAKGAPFTTDWLGTSPLHFAALNNHLETCEVLLRAGISRDARTKVDRTPLHMATYEGHVAIVNTLIHNGAEVDARDMLKMTPLHWAVQNQHLEVVSTLLKHGANPDLVNKFDKTPVDIALELNRMDILQALQVIHRDSIVNELSAEINVMEEEKEEETEATILDEGVGEAEIPEAECDELKTAQNISTGSVKFTFSGNKITSETSLPHKVDIADSIEILKEHGISFLPNNDENSVVATAMENGHSLVLTEVGKQVLNSTKPLVKIPVQKAPAKIKGRKIVTVTTEQLLELVGQKNGIFKKMPGGIVSLNEKVQKRPVVMNKNKIIVSGIPHMIKKPKIEPEMSTDIESITRQLAEARRQAEEYKQMLKRKEAEAERYKRQLQSITQGK